METKPTEQRLSFRIDYASGQWSMRELRERYRVSRPTGYRWVKRVEEQCDRVLLELGCERPSDAAMELLGADQSQIREMSTCPGTSSPAFTCEQPRGSVGDGIARKRSRAMTIIVTVSIDVPDLAQGIAFYCGAFGFSEKARPVPGVAVLHGLDVGLCLLEKSAGSRPSPGSDDRRKFERHWTPVHLDFHVEDLSAALVRVEALGARREQVFENPEHGSAAFCSDPFGNGFCLLERR